MNRLNKFLFTLHSLLFYSLATTFVFANEVSVNISVNDPNYKVPAIGGKLYYSAKMQNTTDTPMEYKWWSVLSLPTGEYYPIHKTRNIRLQSSQIRENKNMRVTIPEWLPAGTYQMFWYVADPQQPGEIVHSAFTFEKMPPARTDGPRHLVAVQSGKISEVTTFGVLPQSGDTLDAGDFTITIDKDFSAGELEAASGTVALRGEFVVESGVTLTVHGDWDASHQNTQNQLKEGASIVFDGETNVARHYLAASGHYRAPSLVVQSSTDNKAFFGLKPGSNATFVYDRQGFLGSNISGGNVHLNGFSTGYTHQGYDRVNTRNCNMPNVLVTNSGRFNLVYHAAEDSTCDFSNLTILSPTSTIAFKSSGIGSSIIQGAAYRLDGLSVDGRAEYNYRSEFIMNDWVIGDLAALAHSKTGWQNVDSWLLFNAEYLPVGSEQISNVYYRLEKYNPHGFYVSEPIADYSSHSIDSVVFDFINLSSGEAGDMYLFSGPGNTGETINISNNIVLKNLNGMQTSTFMTFNNANQNGRRVYLDNNVVYIPNNNAISLNTGQIPTGTLASVSNNLFWGTPGEEGYVIDNLLGTSDSQIDILSQGAYRNNGAYHARKDGSHGELNLPLSYTPESLRSTDNPHFNDDSRRLETYGQQVLNLNGTAEATFNAFITRHLSTNDLTKLTTLAGHESYTTNHKGKLVIKDMIDWIKQGYLPTTTTYHANNNYDYIGLTTNATFLMSDSDGDTLDDRFDSCPNTPQSSPIDENGCGDTQLDDDNDGIANAYDLCANTSSGSTVDNNGCSNTQADQDNDGIADAFDLCTNTPPSSVVNNDGCASTQLDNDNDGIVNSSDLCPDTLPGSVVDDQGCSYAQLDEDNDGIVNASDLCANTPSGLPVDDQGCANTQLDGDNDGIADAFDFCANTSSSGVISPQGCSEAQIIGKIPGFISWGVGGGGAMAGYSINPFNDKIRFVGTDMGTAFRSLNSGQHWAPIRHSETTYSSRLGYAASFGFAGENVVLNAPKGLNPVRSINGGRTFVTPKSFELSTGEHISDWYSDTQNIGTIYAMTNFGLWRSTDAGDHWQFVYNGGAIKGMFIDNHDNGRVYIATADHILRAEDGITFTPYFTPSGHRIHRFSGGSDATHRTLTYASDESNLAIAKSIEAGLNPSDVSATYDKPNTGIEVSAGMVYVKRNQGSFTITDQFMGSYLLMAQNDPNTIYAIGSRGWHIGRAKGTSVYVSLNAGDTWELRLLQIGVDNHYRGWDSTKIEYSPVALNIGWHDAGYYTVGINQLNSGQLGGSGNYFLYGTENHGVNWLDLTNEYEGSTPQNPAKRDDWSSSGLEVTAAHEVKINPANQNHIYAGYADIHGMRSTNGGATWKILQSDENTIYDFAFDPTDANIVYMVNGNFHDFPLGSNWNVLQGRGGVYKSLDQGENWQRITPDNDDYKRQYLSLGYDQTRGYLYAGSQSDGISRSIDGGVTWSKFNDGLPTSLNGTYPLGVIVPQIEVLANGNVYALVTGVRPELTDEEVTALGIPRSFPELLQDTSSGTTRYFSWVNSSQTGIYFLDVVNGATQWQLLRGTINTQSNENWQNHWKPWRRPTSFAIDLQNNNNMWLTDMTEKTWQSSKSSGVWKSSDHGRTWTFQLQHTFPLDIAVDPTDGNYVIVAGLESWNNGGIYYSKDGGQNWIKDSRSPLEDNAATVSFDPRNSEKVIYGYWGGGMLYGDKP